MTDGSSEKQFREDLAQALVLLREARGLAQKELADRLGVHASVLSRYETGVRTPATVKLVALLDALTAGWAELELALEEVRRARAEDEEPSAEALEDTSAQIRDDLLAKFLIASHEGRGREFVDRLMAQLRYIAELQHRLELHLARRAEAEADEEDDENDVDGEPKTGDAPHGSGETPSDHGNGGDEG